LFAFKLLYLLLDYTFDRYFTTFLIATVSQINYNVSYQKNKIVLSSK